MSDAATLERGSAVMLVSAGGCLVASRPMINWLVRLRWRQPMRHEDCPPLQPLQQAKQGTPTMGGLLVIGVALASAAAFGGLSSPEGWIVLAATIGVGAIGLADDLLKLRQPNAKGLRCRPKLIAALAIGGLSGWLITETAAGYRLLELPWLGRQLNAGLWWVPLSMSVVAGCAHAVNLTDGMDGLAAGCLAVAFGALALLALARPLEPGARAVLIWASSLAGGCLGFLWFNTFPASVFLGDVGALGLGAALGILALLSHAALGLLIIGGVFVVEALSVMLQVASYRWRGKRRIFRVAPLHHHFHVGGMSEQQVVVRFWLAGWALAALGFSAMAPS
ncbi:MAG: phospho-N-acetylmuramoyl-pentapeptide-transferase [Candidatus Omnitrophica bacterium]|nr:phospho-N-acetylmuramoyl-pentapeptide-transferase [Candidatus Omnitrophota bacterium]